MTTLIITLASIIGALSFIIVLIGIISAIFHPSDGTKSTLMAFGTMAAGALILTVGVLAVVMVLWAVTQWAG